MDPSHARNGLDLRRLPRPATPGWRRLGGRSASLAIHLGIAGMVLWLAARTITTDPAEVVEVALIEVPSPAPSPTPGPSDEAPSAAAAAASPAPQPVREPQPERPAAAPDPAPEPRPEGRDEPAPPAAPVTAETPSPDASSLAEAPPAPLPSLSNAQLAGARTAGNGQGLGAGGRCDMVQWLQNELRQDREVGLAVARAYDGRPPLVWDGDWVRAPGEEGEGLAILRQAVIVHVAFAPEACRSDPVGGLVVLSLGDGPAAPRLALGASRWEWSDLLS